MIISVINHTNGKLSDEEVQTAIRAINRQIKEDFELYWSLGVMLRLQGKSGSKPKEQGRDWLTCATTQSFIFGTQPISLGPQAIRCDRYTIRRHVVWRIEQRSWSEMIQIKKLWTFIVGGRPFRKK